jgi:hypothetical protein
MTEGSSLILYSCVDSLSFFGHGHVIERAFKYVRGDRLGWSPTRNPVKLENPAVDADGA